MCIEHNRGEAGGSREPTTSWTVGNDKCRNVPGPPALSKLQDNGTGAHERVGK